MVELEELLLWLAASVGGSGRVMMWGTVEEGGGGAQAVLDFSSFAEGGGRVGVFGRPAFRAEGSQ